MLTYFLRNYKRKKFKQLRKVELYLLNKKVISMLNTNNYYNNYMNYKFYKGTCYKAIIL